MSISTQALGYIPPAKIEQECEETSGVWFGILIPSENGADTDSKYFYYPQRDCRSGVPEPLTVSPPAPLPNTPLSCEGAVHKVQGCLPTTATGR